MRNRPIFVFLFILFFQAVDTLPANCEERHLVINPVCENCLDEQLGSIGFSGKSLQNLKKDFKKRWIKNGFDPSFFDETWNAYLSVVKYEVRGGSGTSQFVILSVHAMATYEYEYWFFEKKEDKWALTDVISSDQKNVEGELGYFRWREYDFITIPNGAGGTGISNKGRTVYYVGTDKIIEALEYSTGGYFFGWPSAYDSEYSAEVSFPKENDEKGRLSNVLSVTYFMGRCSPTIKTYGDETPKLFSKDLKCVFVWDEVRKKFILDETDSTVDRFQLDKIPFGLSDDEYVEFYFQELSKIAKRGNEQEKSWLRCLLGKCEPKTEQQKDRFQTLTRLMDK